MCERREHFRGAGRQVCFIFSPVVRPAPSAFQTLTSPLALLTPILIPFLVISRLDISALPNTRRKRGAIAGSVDWLANGDGGDCHQGALARGIWLSRNDDVIAPDLRAVRSPRACLLFVYQTFSSSLARWLSPSSSLPS